MKFDCSRERVKRGLWHRWFAWHPVTVAANDCRWLETVERSGKRVLVANGDGQPEWSWEWNYREPK